jgi:hypothetical protein
VKKNLIAFRKDLFTASQTRTSAMTNQTAATSATTSGRVNTLLTMLSKQEQLVAKLEADAANLQSSCSNNYGTLSDRISTQRGRVMATSAAELRELNSVNERAESWRAELDANITKASNELNSLLANLPNLTNFKVSVSESSM